MSSVWTKSCSYTTHSTTFVKHKFGMEIVSQKETTVKLTFLSKYWVSTWSLLLLQLPAPPTKYAKIKIQKTKTTQNGKWNKTIYHYSPQPEYRNPWSFHGQFEQYKEVEMEKALSRSCNWKISAVGAIIYRPSAPDCKSCNHRRSSHAPVNWGLIKKTKTKLHSLNSWECGWIVKVLVKMLRICGSIAYQHHYYHYY